MSTHAQPSGHAKMALPGAPEAQWSCPAPLARGEHAADASLEAGGPSSRPPSSGAGLISRLTSRC